MQENSTFVRAYIDVTCVYMRCDQHEIRPLSQEKRGGISELETSMGLTCRQNDVGDYEG